MTDYHVHSSYSFDARKDMKIENLAEYALSKGITRLAVCDHYDLNWVKTGENPDIDFARRRERIDASNVANPQVELLNGIELGQATQEQEFAEKVLNDNDFDVVVASLHNIRGMPDFYYIKYEEYSNSQLEDLYRQYLVELCELAKWGRFHILAHMTYPLRYYAKNHRFIALEKFKSYYCAIYAELIRQGIAMEVNTSGLRSNLKCTLPSLSIVIEYIKMGGKLVSVGSDAHTRNDIGFGFDYTVQKLLGMGAEFFGGRKL